MTGILIALLAAVFAAFTNFIFRKNTQNGGCYLLFYYLIALGAVFVLEPALITTSFSLLPFSLGGTVGILNVLLMQSMTKALKTGPSSLTFAFQNASAVFPGLFLFLIFGAEMNFSFTVLQFVGAFLVLAGLYLGTRGKVQEKFPFFVWLRYAFLSFLIQILALSIIQSRHLFIEQEMDSWFMPGQFSFALAMQFILFMLNKEGIERKSAILGLIGGLSNFGTTALLLLSTKVALPYEKAMLFPCFSVTTIILCNLWAAKFYKEKFHFTSHATCALGIIFGVYK